MKAQLCVGVAALALFATAGAAAAAKSTANTESAPLKLTATQRLEIYRDVTKEKMSQAAPAKFIAKVGAMVPSSIKLNPMPATAAKQVPAVKSYDYAMFCKEAILVDPSTKKIANVIKR